MDFYGNPVSICFCRVIFPKVSLPKYQSKHAIFATDLSAHYVATLLHTRIAILRKFHHQFGMEPIKTKKAISAQGKTQISIGIHTIRSGTLLCAQWIAYDSNLLQAVCEGSGQTGRIKYQMLNGRTFHFVGFAVFFGKSMLVRMYTFLQFPFRSQFLFYLYKRH